VAVASAGSYASLHVAPDRKSHQHPTAQFFTGRMPFLPPNQQRQSNEGKSTKGIIIINEYYYSAMKSKKLQEHLTAEKNKTNDVYTHIDSSAVFSSVHRKLTVLRNVFTF